MTNVFGSFGGIVSAVGRLVFGQSSELQELKNENAEIEDEDVDILQGYENNIWDAVNRNQGASPMSCAQDAERRDACAENSDQGVSSRSPAGGRTCSLASSSSHPPGTCGGSSCRSRRRRSSICGKRKRLALAVGLQSEFGCPLCFELLVTPFDGFGCGHMLCGQCLLDMVEHSEAVRASADQFDFLDSEEAFLRHLRLPSCPSCRKVLPSLPRPAIPMVKNAIQLVATNSLNAEEKKEYDERVAGETESHFRNRFAEILQPKLDDLSDFKKQKKRHGAAQRRQQEGAARRQQQEEEAARRLQQAEELEEVMRQQDEVLRLQQEELVRWQQQEEAARRQQVARWHRDEALLLQHDHQIVQRIEPAHGDEVEHAQQEILRGQERQHAAPHQDHAPDGNRRLVAVPPPADHPGARDRELDRRVAEVIGELENLPRRVSVAPDHRGGADNGDGDGGDAAQEIEDLLNDPNHGFIEEVDRVIEADFAREVDRVMNERREPEANAGPHNNAPAALEANRVLYEVFDELDARGPVFEYDKHGRAKCRLCNEKIDRESVRVKLARPQGFWHAECAVREYTQYFHVEAAGMPGYGNISAEDLGHLGL